MNDLRKLCDDMLIGSLRPEMRAALDAALSHGATPEFLMEYCRDCANKAGANDDGLTVLAIRAYLEARGLKWQATGLMMWTERMTRKGKAGRA